MYVSRTKLNHKWCHYFLILDIVIYNFGKCILEVDDIAPIGQEVSPVERDFGWRVFL